MARAATRLPRLAGEVAAGADPSAAHWGQVAAWEAAEGTEGRGRAVLAGRAAEGEVVVGGEAAAREAVGVAWAAAAGAGGAREAGVAEVKAEEARVAASAATVVSVVGSWHLRRVGSK